MTRTCTRREPWRRVSLVPQGIVLLATPSVVGYSRPPQPRLLPYRPGPYHEAWAGRYTFSRPTFLRTDPARSRMGALPARRGRKPSAKRPCESVRAWSTTCQRPRVRRCSETRRPAVAGKSLPRTCAVEPERTSRRRAPGTIALVEAAWAVACSCEERTGMSTPGTLLAATAGRAATVRIVSAPSAIVARRARGFIVGLMRGRSPLVSAACGVSCRVRGERPSTRIGRALGRRYDGVIRRFTPAGRGRWFGPAPGPPLASTPTGGDSAVEQRFVRPARILE